MISVKTGLFFTFEGGEGAGKTTLIEKIYTALLKADYPALKTREPGGTKLSEAIRPLILHRKDFSFFSTRSELCLYLASRAQQVEEVILPALQEGKIVLCDRFNDSTIAYQGYGRGLDIEEVSHFCAFISQNLTPDLTFFLDIDPQKGLERGQGCHCKPRFDRIEAEGTCFHEKVRNGYHALAETEKRIRILDASQSPEKVFAEAWKETENLLSYS
jgi:dTMP kinase